MHACGDGSLVHEGYLGSPKHFEHVDCLDDARADGLASNLGLVLLTIHPALLDDAEANVDNVTLFILKPVLLVYAAPVKRRRMRASNPLAGCQSTAMRCRFASQFLAVVLPYWLMNQRKRSTKMILGLQRRRCWKEARTWDDMASRKTLARAVFIVMMSACVFLSRKCVAWTVAWLLLSAHAV
jgi:hypothetical protein